jgi:small subunit ribosomal protein S5
MSETNKPNASAEPAVSQAVASAVAKTVFGEGRGEQRGQRGAGGNRFRGNKRPDRQKEEFEQRILDIARVTRVMKGGKRMNFRACVAIGDKRGHFSTGMGKGADVTLAVNKAVNQAKKTLFLVPIVNDTIPHDVYGHVGASKILFKPAKKGKGVIAGGVVRIILELAGIKNAYSKILGASNKINNARCTVAALKKLKKVSRPVKAEAKKEIKPEIKPEAPKAVHKAAKPEVKKEVKKAVSAKK